MPIHFSKEELIKISPFDPKLTTDILTELFIKKAKEVWGIEVCTCVEPDPTLTKVARLSDAGLESMEWQYRCGCGVRWEPTQFQQMPTSKRL